MASRAVCIARWHEPDPVHADCVLSRNVAFVITDDEQAVSWGEQVKRIAELVPEKARWEVLPVPADVDELTFLKKEGL